jgi:hypothetical protein
LTAHDPQTQADIAASMARSVRERGPRWACRLLDNLGRTRRALPSTRPLEGRTAVILGAGPSLDLAGPHLDRWQAEGACIISTNTAARACAAHGVQPDVVCFAETDPIVSSHLEGVTPGVIVLGGYASVELADAAEATGCPVAFAVGPEPAVTTMALQLGMDPLWYSGCVAVMAVAIARYLGASRIVLAGVDAAYTAEAMYARHTPFEDLRPHVETFDTSIGPTDLLITVGQPGRPLSKRRQAQRAVYAENNAGGKSLTEAQLLAPVELFAPAGRGVPMQTISPHAVVMPDVAYLDASEVVIAPFASRADVPTVSVQASAARGVLEEVHGALSTWDPHESVYGPPSVPLASFWGESRAQRPDVKLAEQRALMVEARRAMLEACESGLGRC